MRKLLCTAAAVATLAAGIAVAQAQSYSYYPYQPYYPYAAVPTAPYPAYQPGTGGGTGSQAPPVYSSNGGSGVMNSGRTFDRLSQPGYGATEPPHAGTQGFYNYGSSVPPGYQPYAYPGYPCGWGRICGQP